LSKQTGSHKTDGNHQYQSELFHVGKFIMNNKRQEMPIAQQIC